MHFISDPADNISTLVSSFMSLYCCRLLWLKSIIFYSVIH